jgi:hypothetical protein
MPGKLPPPRPPKGPGGKAASRRPGGGTGDITELTNSSFDTRSPLTLQFEEHQRGLRVYLCGAWEIEREGEKGPYGDIEEVVIP